MAEHQLFNALEANDVSIYTPDNFDLQMFIDHVLDGTDEIRTLCSLDDPNIKLDFTREYNYKTGKEFINIDAHDGLSGKNLLSQSDRGYTTGHINEVKAFMEENFSGGFFDEDLAASRIDGYEELADHDFEEYMTVMDEYGEAWVEPKEPGMTMPVTMEQIPETPKLDLEGKTLEQQAKVVKAVGDKLVPEILHNYFSAMEYAIKEDAMLRPMMDEMRNPSDELKGFLEKIPSNLASAVDHGFIPPVMREGYVGRPDAVPVLTSNLVQEIREKYDPEFGKVCGVDTTTFYTGASAKESGMEANVAVIPISYDVIKPYVEGARFKESDILSVRVIKDFGDTMDVQGKPFHVTNLDTFEVRFKGETGKPEVHTCTLVVDDMGVCRGNLHYIASDRDHCFSMFPDGTTGVSKKQFDAMKFEPLDRTNPDNKGYIKDIRDIDSFRQEVNDRIPGFLDQFNKEYYDGLEKRPDDGGYSRKEYIRGKEMYLESQAGSLRDTVNIVGLYKEKLNADLVHARGAAVEKIQEIVDLKHDMDKLSPDSRVSNGLAGNMEKLKTEYADKFNIYRDTLAKYKDTEKTYSKIKDSYKEFQDKREEVSKENHRLFQNESTNGDKIEKELTPSERFGLLCENACIRENMNPSWSSIDVGKIQDKYEKVVKESIDTIRDVVKEYNQGTDVESEKINFGDLDGAGGEILSSGPSTKDGFQILADEVRGGKEIGEAYNPRLDQEGNKRFTEANFGAASNDPSVKANLSNIDAQEKAKGSQYTREEVYNNFKNQGIKDGCGNIALEKAAHDYKVSIADFKIEGIPDAVDVKDILKSVENKVTGMKDEKSDVEKKERQDFVEKKEDADEIKTKDSTDQDEQNEQNHQDTDKDKNSFDQKVGRAMHGAYGKINVDKKVELSKEKAQQFEKEAEQEIKDSDKLQMEKEAKEESVGDPDKYKEIYEKKLSDKAAEIYQSKAEAHKVKLDEIKNDILRYKDKMDSFSYLPPKSIMKHSGFQLAKVEYDCAIRMYEKMGGKIGEDCFVAKSLSASEMFMTKSELMNSNYAATMLFDKFSGFSTNANIRSIHIDKDGNRIRSYSPGFSSYVENGSALFEALNAPVAYLDYAFFKLFNLDPTAEDFENRIRDAEKTTVKEVLSEFKDRVEKFFFKQEEKNDVENTEKDNIEKEQEEKDPVDKDEKDQAVKDEKDSAIKDEKDSPVKEEKEDIDKDDHQDIDKKEEDTEIKEKDSVGKDSDDRIIRNEESDTKEDMSDKHIQDSVEKSKNEDTTKVEKADTDKEKYRDTEKKEQDASDKDEKSRMEKEDIGKERSQDIEKKEEDLTDKKERDTIDRDEKDQIEKEEKDSVDKKEENLVEKTEVDRTEKKEDVEKTESQDTEKKNEDPSDKNEKEQVEKKESDPDTKPEKDTTDKDEKDKIDKDDNNSVGKNEDKTEKYEDDKIEKNEEDLSSKEEQNDLERTEDEQSVKDTAIQSETDLQVETKETDDLDNLEHTEDTHDIESEERQVKEDAMISDPETISQPDVSTNPEEDQDDDHMEAGKETGKTDTDADFLSDIKDRIMDVIDAKEELNEVIQDIIDRSLDGLDPIDLFDSMTDSFADSIISGEADPDSIGDILYEYAETFTDPVIEFVDSALDKLADLGVSSDFISDVEGHIADIFEQIDGPFENTLSGEYEGITFTPAEDISGNDFEFSRINDLEMSGIDQFQAFDSVTGDEFFGQNDLSSDLGYMENTVEDFMNDSLTDVEMDICQSINDVMNNLTDQGIDIDSADNQVLWDSIQDQITNDAVNGMDIRDPDYIQSTTDESMHLVNKMNDGLNDMDQINDVDFSHSNDTSYQDNYQYQDTDGNFSMDDQSFNGSDLSDLGEKGEEAIEAIAKLLI